MAPRRVKNPHDPHCPLFDPRFWVDPERFPNPEAPYIATPTKFLPRSVTIVFQETVIVHVLILFLGWLRSALQNRQKRGRTLEVVDEIVHLKAEP